MDKIYGSATKLVFVVTAFAVIAGLFTGFIDSKDFMVLASMAFTFYFSKRPDSIV